MEQREAHVENLRRQIERTRGTYLMMREAGYDKSRSVPLRFAYQAAPQADAEALAEHLREKMGYSVTAEDIDEGFMVHGYTRPVKLSAATLGKWVHWMCITGYRHGCVFDGWGARVSSS